MKKTIFILTVLACFLSIEAGTLIKIRSNAEAKNHRVVFEVEGLKGFKTDKKNDLVTITVYDCDLSSAASNVRVSSKFITDFNAEQSGNSVKISFNLPKEFKVKTFKIDQPDRIVLDVSPSGYIQPPAMAEPASVKANILSADKTKKAKADEDNKIKIIKSKKPEKLLQAMAGKAIVPPDALTLDNIKKWLSAKEFDRVITSATTIIKERPATILPYYYRSTAYLEKGNLEKVQALKNKYYKDAVQDLNKVVIDSLSFTQGHAKIAEIYRLLGDQTKAEEHYAIFMSSFEHEKDSSSEEQPDAQKIIPSSNMAANDSTNNISFMGKSLISNLFLYVAAFLVFVLILLFWIRKKMNDKIADEVDDVPSDEPDKDDLFENLRPKEATATLTSSKVADSTGKNKKSFMTETSFSLDAKQNPAKVKTSRSDMDITGTLLKTNSEDDDFVSISLDENTRDRIIELYDDGYTNKEIAEQLKISYDEVNFVIRSLGEADNEKKNKNKDIQNSQAGGISDSQNEETMQMKEIQELYEQGVSIEELASYFKKPKDEVDFIVSLIEKNPPPAPAIKESPPVVNSQSFVKEEENKLSYKIKDLAELGLSRKKIAEELMIGLDEVDFAAAMFKIDFAEEPDKSVKFPDTDAISHESVVDWTNEEDSKTVEPDKTIPPVDQEDEYPEETDESMLISLALEHEKEQELKDIDQQNQFEDSKPLDIVDRIINETEAINEFSDINDYPEEKPAKPAVQSPVQKPIIISGEQFTREEPKQKPSAPKIMTKEEIGIDLDNFLTTRSINQDFGIAESRIFNFNKDEFKDVFNKLASEDEDLADNKYNNIKNDLHEIQNKPVKDDQKDDDFFVKKINERKQMTNEVKFKQAVNLEDVDNKFEAIDKIIEKRLNIHPETAKSESPVNAPKKSSYNEPELSKSFEDIINDYEPSSLNEDNMQTEKDDDDLLLMREVYKRLDLGQEAESIAKDLEIGIDDVLIYKKIKDGND